MRRLWGILFAFLLAACAAHAPVAAGGSQPATAPVQLPAEPGTGAASATPPWSGLNLAGHLVLVHPGQDGFGIERLDLGSGKRTPLYQSPQGALLSTALVSPDGKQMLLTYAPPATAQNQTTFTSLYLLPADGSGTPQPLFKTPPDGAFFAPVWAPDGRSIYASHFTRGPKGDGSDDRFAIDRVGLGGNVQTLLEDGIWPSFSPDGKQIAYVSATPQTTGNELYLADADGSHPRRVLPEGAFPAVDDHFFTPDGKAIIFSAVNAQAPATPSPTLWDRLFGIRIASAHTVPSDWYRVSLDSGKVDRLTQLGDVGMYATLSPDQGRIAFIAQSGVYVMNLDGTQLTQLSDQVATGTVDWEK